MHGSLNFVVQGQGCKESRSTICETLHRINIHLAYRLLCRIMVGQGYILN